MHYLLLICLVPLAVGLHLCDQEHHPGHHHPGHHLHHGPHKHHPEQIEQTKREITTEKQTPQLRILKDREDQTCICVPHYLCNTNFVGVDANNASVTGYNVLEPRVNTAMNQSRSSFCQNSIELCCERVDIIPYKQIPTENNPTTQDPTKSNPTTTIPPSPKPAMMRKCGMGNPKGLDIGATRTTDTEALFGEFPWVVGIMSDGVYYGGGALIHPRVVITAAHVVSGQPSKGLRIRAGEWDTSTLEEKFGFQEKNVIEVYAHDGLTDSALGNNIALLLLESPLQLDEHINVICMPDQNENFSNFKGCVANGWGKTSYGKKGGYANIMKRVVIDMMENSRCDDLLRAELGGDFSLHSTAVCAGGEEGKDTCTGDGGSPLSCHVGKGQYKLTGLVVAGVECGKKDVPAVYSGVAKFRQWVDNKMAAWGLDSSFYTSKDDRSVLMYRNLD